MFLFRRLFIIAAVLLVLCAPAVAQPETTTLFQNVRVFDGKSGTVGPASNVLIKGNIIASVSTADIAVGSKANPTIIAGGGRVLMPGGIEAHWHAMMVAPTFATALTADMGYINLVAGQEAEATLMRGFTTVRDMGGPTFGLKRAIDEGIVAGPRIYPSGAFISQTAGHGDFRQLTEIPRTPASPLSHSEQVGVAAIADSADDVRLRTRENLMRGASEIKLMAGGGVSSPFGPLDTTQYTEAELHAAVEAAEDWGTYVAVHAYTPRSIKRAIDTGVLCIEHGQLLDQTTARLKAATGPLLRT